MSTFTSSGEFKDSYTTLFRTFASGRTKDLAWRKWQLKQVWWMFDENEAAILAALKSDLNRSEFESYVCDVRGVREDVLRTLKNIDKWAADDIPNAGLILGTLSGARIRKEPLGVVLIIGAWNFPAQLIIKPMIAAIAAGCCVMLKPSELSCATQNLFAELVPKYLDPSAIRVVTGGPQETQEILKRRFNHIFFTGSNKVAKFVTEAAAKYLTPTVLELGGQGPAVVTAKANVDLAAKRIAYVKYMNAGQICLSVNHIFVDPSVHDEFVEKLGFWFNTFIAEKPENMVRIVNVRNWDRLTGLLNRSNGKLVYGGKKDRDIKYLEPTIMTDIGYDDSLFSEELFGPICPIIKADYKAAYRKIASMEHPLALYIFSLDNKEVEEIIAHTNSGGVTVNDVLIHVMVPNAPFGGVGDSGHGYYHGKYGFDEFTHLRTIVSPPMFLEKLFVLGMRYPPFKGSNITKMVVKNSLGFKKGETLEDQRKRPLVPAWVMKAAGIVAMLAVMLAVMDKTKVPLGYLAKLKNFVGSS
ncbi:Aldehyde/histidinol dehydrogenase [Pyronema omphalodes]|nr:Aldehyde/histidinol dehydrogenase [Pyronema omphalodes]